MSEWIDVEDRLPEDSRHVIIALLGISVFVGHYNPGKKKWRLGLNNRDHANEIVAVTHWMPLQLPPTEIERTPENGSDPTH